MKKQLVLALGIFITFNGCELVDLPRDNPNDIHFDGDEGDLSGNLVFDSYQVCQALPLGNTLPASSLAPSAEAWIEVKIKNSGTGSVKGVTGVVTCNSNYINIQGYPSGYALRFVNSNDIFSGEIFPNGYAGLGQITTGENYYTTGSSSCNFSFHSIKVTVASNTPIGTAVTFNLQLTDDKGESWSDSFSIPVN